MPYHGHKKYPPLRGPRGILSFKIPRGRQDDTFIWQYDVPFIRRHDNTFNYWYDINAIYPIPRGMGDFFLKYPGGPRGGGF